MKRTKYPIHPDFKKWEHVNPPLHKTFLPVMQKVMGTLFLREKSSDAITVNHLKIGTSDGKTIRALLYTPAGVSTPAPCLVYYHGGGFVLPAAPHHYNLVKEYSLKALCKVLLVDYRLAPKFAFPVAPEDCFSAYQWVLKQAQDVGIDPSLVAVGGDSAGGELATVVCLMARDQSVRIPCAQMLIYPVTARGLETESMKKYVDTPMCNSRDMGKYDRFYIQDEKAGKREYMSPIDADSLADLPPAYIETAEFDCLRDGGQQYAERLEQFLVPVELHNTVGTIHGFDIEVTSSIVRECVERRVAFLQKAFRRGLKCRGRILFSSSEIELLSIPDR